MSNNVAPSSPTDLPPRANQPRPKPRLSIATQIYLLVLGFALALLLTSLLAWNDAGHQALVRTQAEIDEGLQIVRSDFERESLDLTALGTYLLTQDNFLTLVRNRDGGALGSYLQDWLRVTTADSIIISDPQGTVLAEARIGEPTASGGSVVDLPGVLQAQKGQRSFDLGQDSTGRILGRVFLPFPPTDDGAPRPVMILGFYVDGRFLQARAQNSNQELALVYHDKLAIITLTDQQGKPWVGTAPPASVAQAARDGKSSDFVTLDSSPGPYLFRFQPLASAPANSGTLFGVGVPLAVIDAERADLFRTFGLGLLVIAAIMGALGFAFARSLTGTIRSLGASARAMAGGELSQPIQLSRNDELGDLANEMETMRLQLHSALDAAMLEKSRYAAVIQWMGAAAVLTDEHLKIVGVNRAAESLLHAREAQLLQQPWWDLFKTNGTELEQPEAWRPADGDVENQVIPVMQGRFHLRAQPQVTLEVISTPVTAAGTPAGFVHVLRDATAQEQLGRARDEFMMNAAHELRSPLAALRASIDLLIDDYRTMTLPDLGLMLRTMQRSTAKFQGLVENLVDVGNIQAGRFRVRPAPTPVDLLVRESLERVEPLLLARSQTPNVEIDCAAPYTVYADRARIVQVLVNLISNASKYSPEGLPISVGASDDADTVRFQVIDHGPGIPPEEQANLFQRFYRGKRAEEEGIGIGLGLALAREIIEAHGGRLEVSSAPGEGAVFWFSLPKANGNVN